MSQSQPAALILTLKLDQTTFELVNGLRQQHFPVARNLIPAHVTLFHALPGEQEAAIGQHLRSLCDRTANIALTLAGVRSLGSGVALELDAPDLIQLRQALATTWSDWLTAQDRQGYRPHVTIQNKVGTAEARQLYGQLREDWQPHRGYGEGLLLWYYRNGPWELAEEFCF